MTVIITLPGVPPNIANQRKYKNPHVYRALREEWKRTVYYGVSIRDRGWLQAMAKLGKRMRVDVNFQHTRLFDVDGKYHAMKPILDVLVELGFLAGDKEENISLDVQQEKIRSNMTVISIREAPGQEWGDGKSA